MGFLLDKRVTKKYSTSCLKVDFHKNGIIRAIKKEFQFDLYFANFFYFLGLKKGQLKIKSYKYVE